MQLIGMLDSPYVRRVAISLKLWGLPHEHRKLSVFRNFEEFARINPMVKAPTLVCDDGEILIDSTLILDYLEELAGPGRSLMPPGGPERRRALQLIGFALTACDKTVQVIYERQQRPPEKQHQPWLERVGGQIDATYAALEAAAMRARPWLLGERLTQADVTVAVAWRFTQYYIADLVEAARYPLLSAYSARAEQLPEFLATPLD
ncbi:MAG: glutathione S-transferase [Nevskia sp.]|nr:glutathione S-transferase [Nevskia sp.]